MRKHLSKSIFFILLCILSISGQTKATTIVKIGFDQVCKDAELIFEGKVVSKEMQRSPYTGNPYTYFTLEIIDIVKGNYDESTIELGFMGGQQGDYVMNVNGMRLPELNEKGIFFVESLSDEFVNPLVGWHQGHYLVVPDPFSGQELVVPVLQDRSAMTVAPTLSTFKQNVRDSIR